MGLVLGWVGFGKGSGVAYIAHGESVRSGLLAFWS